MCYSEGLQPVCWRNFILTAAPNVEAPHYCRVLADPKDPIYKCLMLALEAQKALLQQSKCLLVKRFEE